MLGVIGLVAMGSGLMVFGFVSHRLGEVLRASPYHCALYLGAVCVWGGALTRLLFLTGSLASFPVLYQNSIYVLLAYGLPALGVTLALLATWYYWSWLLAERN